MIQQHASDTMHWHRKAFYATGKTTLKKRAYSQKVLKEALLKLLVDRPLSKITVQKLCETADVNRTTFYSNFEDIFALYRQIQDDFLEQMAVFTQQQKPYADNRALICDIFRFLYENMDSCRVLILRSEDAFLERLFALQYDVSYSLMKKAAMHLMKTFDLSVHVPRLRAYRNHP